MFSQLQSVPLIKEDKLQEDLVQNCFGVIDEIALSHVPMVEPHAMSLRMPNSCNGTPAFLAIRFSRKLVSEVVA